MRIADVPPRRLRRLVQQEQRVGDVADVHEVPQLQLHLAIPCRERFRTFSPGLLLIGAHRGEVTEARVPVTFQAVGDDGAARVQCGLQQGPDHQGRAERHHVQPGALGVVECLELCQGLGEAIPVLAE